MLNRIDEYEQEKPQKKTIDRFIFELKQQNIIPSSEDVLEFIKKEELKSLNDRELRKLEKQNKIYFFNDKESYLNNVRNQGYISFTEFINKQRIEQQDNNLINTEFIIDKDGMFTFDEEKSDDTFIKEMVDSRPKDLGQYILKNKDNISSLLFNSILNHLEQSNMSRRQFLQLLSDYLESDKSIYEIISKTDRKFFINDEGKVEEKCQVKFSKKNQIIEISPLEKEMKIKDIKELLTKYKLSKEGSKQELIDRLKDYEEAQEKKKEFEKQFGKESWIEKKILKKYELKPEPSKVIKKYQGENIKEIKKGESKVQFSYDENNILESSKQLFYNKIILTTTYYPNGKEKVIKYFDQDGKLNRLLEYDEHGNLIKEESYKNGIKEGLQKELIDGTLIETMYFEGNPITMKPLGLDKSLEQSQLDRIKKAQRKEQEYRLNELEPELTLEEKENSHCIRI